MTGHEIMKDLFFIERGYLNGNHFVYRSEAAVLIDTGYISDFTETADLIKNLGVDLAQVARIINTHCHCDHIGGNRFIQEKSGCEIALHRIGKYFIDSRDSWSTWWKYYDQKARFFDCTQSLEDGDMIAVGPHEFQVIHTPGHAADGIVLYNRKEKVLLSSDTLWQNDLPVVTIRIEGSSALFSMLESLEKLEYLDVGVVYPGHGKPFDQIEKALAVSKEKVGRYMKDKALLGLDLLKKIMVYTLLMHRYIHADEFYQQLMGTHWYKETVDLYFDGEYQKKYRQILEKFLQRGVIKLKDGQLFTTVKP